MKVFWAVVGYLDGLMVVVDGCGSLSNFSGCWWVVVDCFIGAEGGGGSL